MLFFRGLRVLRGCALLILASPSALAQVPIEEMERDPPTETEVTEAEAPAEGSGEPKDPPAPEGQPSNDDDAEAEEAVETEEAPPTEPGEAATEPPGQTDATPSSPASAGTKEEEPEEQKSEELVPRLKAEEEPRSALPEPIASLERDRYRPRKIPTRQDETPGDYVARPLTLARGTFFMNFGQGLIFAQSDSFSALAPGFAWGITEFAEIGVDGPLRFDAGTKEWAALDPRPHVAFTVYDEEQTEVGLRLRGLVPVTTDVDPALGIAIPVLWHFPEARVDAVPEVELGIADETRIKVFVPITGSLQMSDGVYAGLTAQPHFGLTTDTKTGFDSHIFLGLTHQSRDRAYMDVVFRLFAKNVATGEDDFSDGIGGMVSLSFFPELY